MTLIKTLKPSIIIIFNENLNLNVLKVAIGYLLNVKY